MGRIQTVPNLTAIPGDPKLHVFYQLEQKLMEIRWSINFWISQVHGGTCGSSNPSCGYFPNSGIHNWNTHTQHLPEPTQSFSDLWIKNRYTNKGQVETIRTPWAYQNSKPEETLFPGEIAEIIATTKNVKDVGMVITTTPPFNSPIQLMQKTDKSYIMTVCYLNLISW